MTYIANEKIILIPQKWNVESTQKNKHSVKVNAQLKHESSLTWLQQPNSKDHDPSSPLFIGDGTPFPNVIIDLMRKHKIQRLLIQSNSQSTSSTNSMMDPYDQANAHYDYSSFFFPLSQTRGPAGVSIHANLFLEKDDSMDQKKQDHEIHNRFHTILRALSGTRVLCAPLDAIHRPRHGYVSLSSETFNNTMDLVQISTHLPQEPGTLCGTGIHMFKTLFLPCREHAGIFASGPSPHLLLGLGLGHEYDIWDRNDRKRSVFIDVELQSGSQSGGQSGGQSGSQENHHLNECYHSSSTLSHHQCRLTINQGVQYTIHIPLSPYIQKNNDGTNVKYGFSLSPILLGSANQKSFPTPDIQNFGLHTQTLKACPLVNSSTIETIMPSFDAIDPPSEVSFSFSPIEKRKVSNQSIYTHDLLTLGSMDMNLPWMFLPISHFPPTHPDPDSSTAASQSSKSTNEWMIHRMVKPYSGVSSAGVLHTSVRNGHTSCAAIVDVVDLYPTFAIKPIFHTLRLSIYEGNGAGHEHFVPQTNSYTQKTDLTWEDISIQYHTNINRATSLYLPQLLLPSDSSLWISIHYEPLFRPFETFPADPNRGINIPPSVATFSCHCGLHQTDFCSMQSPIRLYSSSIIVMPPVPDMSMPFNVISLTSTVYAFLIATLLNMLVKVGSEFTKNKYCKKKTESKLDRIKAKVKKMTGNIKRNWMGRSSIKSDLDNQLNTEKKES